MNNVLLNTRIYNAIRAGLYAKALDRATIELFQKKRAVFFNNPHAIQDAEKAHERAREIMRETTITLKAIHDLGKDFCYSCRGLGEKGIEELEKLFAENDMPNWRTSRNGKTEIPLQ